MHAHFTPFPPLLPGICSHAEQIDVSKHLKYKSFMSQFTLSAVYWDLVTDHCNTSETAFWIQTLNCNQTLDWAVKISQSTRWYHLVLTPMAFQSVE